jgi:hypothetical protein
VHLKDLISLYEAMPDYLEDGKVNVHKLLALYNHINELVQLQEVAPPLEANKDLVHLLTVRFRPRVRELSSVVGDHSLHFGCGMRWVGLPSSPIIL